MIARSEHGIHRRVSGTTDIRLDGAGDLLMRCQGASVFDVACNRGMIAMEFARHGATLVHGCDMYEGGMMVAGAAFRSAEEALPFERQIVRELFADIRLCKHRFETVDLTGGPDAIQKAFGGEYGQYDFFLAFGIWHKLVRVMQPADLENLFVDFCKRTNRYFVWRGGDEIKNIDAYAQKAGGLKLVQWSIMSELGPVGIWRRE